MRKMQLSVKDTANLLKVNEKTIYRWINQGKLPAYRIGNHFRFNRAELLEWVTSRQMNVSADFFKEPDQPETTLTTLSEALNVGGIYYRVEGNNKESAIKNVVALMKLPPEVDRSFLTQVLLAREALASTAIGDGIAIPHVRNPIIYHIEQPIVLLCFLEKLVDFHSLDGKPVNCLFTLVSPTVKAHLFLLARLAYILRDPDFKKILRQQAGREEIFIEIARIEAGLKQIQSSPAERKN